MADVSSRPFRVRFPAVQLRPEYGGKRALVIFAAKPQGADGGVVLVTCMDIDGKIHANLPMELSAIKAAAVRPIFLMEVKEDGFVAPMGGLVGPTGRPL
jgi:hypothetical protein